MTSFTIIGTGNMGSAIGSPLAAGGNDVTHISHEQSGVAPITGDFVVLAVPYPAVSGVLDAYADQLGGKAIVDITNPLNFETFDSLTVPAGSSAAAEIQAKLPNSTVLKAFNTNFAATLTERRVGGLPTTVLVAGPAGRAKSDLIAAIIAGGLAAKDAGSLARAHELEALGFLQLTLAVGEKISWSGGFAVAA
ncbi:MAG: NADPH-dependent F420 reductase [Pseudolysinimonas sp.]